MEEKFLPLGTVVMIANAKKPLMIIGFCTSLKDNNSVLYDYNGCVYPEGVLDSSVNFLFNHNQIVEILYMGYKSELDVQFKKKIKKTIEEKKLNVG